jgi:hypothetical protein
MIEISFLLLALAIGLVASGLWVLGRSPRDEDYKVVAGKDSDRGSN